MKNALSATKLVEKSNQEEGLIQSLIPDWVIRLGGASLVVGGLGYLWYRNSGLRQYNEMTLEDFHRFLFKIEMKIFVLRYTEARKTFNQLVGEAKLRDARGVLNLEDPQTQKKFYEATKDTFIKNIFPVMLSEIKNSKYSKILGVFFEWKTKAVQEEISRKMNQRIELTHTENQFKNMNLIAALLAHGNLFKPFQMQKIVGQGDCLDHQECLQLLVDYESQTIRELVDLYKRIATEGRSRDLKQRADAFNNLFEERLRMESLEAYTVEKLGAAYTELPEEEKYHPLILFLNKAFTLPPNLGYNSRDVCNLFRFYFYEFSTLIQVFLSRVPSLPPIKSLTEDFRNQIRGPQFQGFLKESGLTFDLYEEFA